MAENGHGTTGPQPTRGVPSAHAAFVDGFLKQAGEIPGLLAAAVSGSWVDGRIDEHSDVDLVLVTQPGTLVDEAERRRLAGELGALRTAIVGTHVGEPRLLLCLYGEPVLHVDLVFVEEPDLPALGQRLEPLYVHPEAPELSWPEARERRPVGTQWCEDRVWFSLHYLTTKTARGELHEVISALGWFRSQVLVSLLSRAHGLNLMGLRRLEQSGIPELAALARTHAVHEREAIVEAIRESFSLYVALRDGADDEVVVNEAAEREMRGFFEAQLGRPLEISARAD